MPQVEETKACPYCGESIKPTAVKCRYCGSYLDGREPEPDEPDAALKMILPVGRSGWAIASGYLGLLSFVPMIGLAFAVLAVITGFMALKEIRAKPKLGGKGRAVFGIVAGILCGVLWGFIVVIFLIGSTKKW